MTMSSAISIHRIIINHRVNGLSIRNWASNMATYASCGQGSHGKIEPAMATMHKIIHMIQHTMSIHKLLLIKIIHLNSYQNIIV